MVDLTKMDAVDEAVDGFAEAMAEESGDVAPAVGQSEAEDARRSARTPTRRRTSHLSDLGMLAAAIGEAAPEVADQADGRRRPRSTTRSSARSRAPSPPAPPASRSTSRRWWTSPTRRTSTSRTADDWSDFLEAYYGAGAAIPEEEQAHVHRPGHRAGGRRSTTAASRSPAPSTRPGSTTSPRRRSATRIVNDDDSITYFGEEIADFDDDGDAPGRDRHLRPDRPCSSTTAYDSAYAYVALDLSDDLETAFFDIPLTYYASTDPRQRRPAGRAAVDGPEHRGGQVRRARRIYIYDEESGGYGELAPDPEGIIVPDVLTVTAGGEQVWEPTTDVGLYADIPNLTYDFVPLDSGDDAPGRPDDLRLRRQRQHAELAGRGAVMGVLLRAAAPGRGPRRRHPGLGRGSRTRGDSPMRSAPG